MSKKRQANSDMIIRDDKRGQITVILRDRNTARIPHDFIDSPLFTAVPAPALKLWLLFVRFADWNDWICWPSRQRLASQSGMSVRTVARGIEDLLNLGMLERLQAGGGDASSRYRVIPSPGLNLARGRATDGTGAVPPVTRGRAIGDTGVVSRMAQELNTVEPHTITTPAAGGPEGPPPANRERDPAVAARGLEFLRQHRRFLAETSFAVAAVEEIVQSLPTPPRHGPSANRRAQMIAALDAAAAAAVRNPPSLSTESTPLFDAATLEASTSPTPSAQE